MRGLGLTVNGFWFRSLGSRDLGTWGGGGGRP